jgi:hypothetical protein
MRQITDRIESRLLARVVETEVENKMHGRNNTQCGDLESGSGSNWRKMCKELIQLSGLSLVLDAKSEKKLI